MQDVQHKLAVARGEEPADLVFKNGKIVNVLSGEIHGGDIAVSGGRVVGIGTYEGAKAVDLGGRYIAPSFIDGHIHIESTMLTPPEFARAVVPRGTCAAVVDPHEFANVLGEKGVQYVLDASSGLPMNVFVMMSSCVPATHLETSGAVFTADHIAAYINMNNVAGVAELMNFPGVYLGWESELQKIAAGKRKPIDGHSPKLGGKNLNAYILAGVQSDHECTSFEEAREKLRLGMHVLLREGTAERNLHDLLPLVTPVNARCFSFATDDKHPGDLMDEGHIDHHVREAIRFGVDPIVAIQIASLNTARHYRLRNIGAIAPRYWANFVVFDSLEDLRVRQVYYKGILVAEEGRYLAAIDSQTEQPDIKNTMRVLPFYPDQFRVHAKNDAQIKVIELVPNQIITHQIVETPTNADGLIVADPERDILKLAVIERHRATGNIGLGFVRGFGLKKGALASTVAHDAHNIIIVGTNDRDMMIAALELIRMGGGLCAVADGALTASLPLPVAGLVSDQPLEAVRAAVDTMKQAAQSMGCTVPDPFMALSFLALSPIPELKVTDKGLVDAVKFEVTDLFVS